MGQIEQVILGKYQTSYHPHDLGKGIRIRQIVNKIFAKLLTHPSILKKLVGSSFMVYGISTFIGYLTPSPFLYK